MIQRIGELIAITCLGYIGILLTLAQNSFYLSWYEKF
jgi:hypothetical protein